MQADRLVEESKKVRRSLEGVEAWVEARDYKGYEPFDGLSSMLRPLTFGVNFFDRLLLQLIRQSPINLRPILGVRPLDSTKGRGYMAAGYLTMLRLTGDPRYEQRARLCLDWLIDHKSPWYQHFSWANHFDFAGRAGGYRKHESIIVWTSLIGQAFLDACVALKDDRYRKVAASICSWILELPRLQTASGSCLSYRATTGSYVHNSNMLGAAMLARAAVVLGKPEYLPAAAAAMEYSCSRQLPDGSWYYGEEAHFRWIDNFHTGYNLDSLKTYIECTGDRTYEEVLRRGYRFFADNFFEADGRPKYYHNRAYPIDIQCASQAIETLALFGETDDSALQLGLKVAGWTIDNMQDPKGYFHYRHYPLMRAKTPMLHWGQTTMYKGLAALLFQLSQRVPASARKVS